MASHAREPGPGEEHGDLVLSHLHVGHRTVIVASGEIDIVTVPALAEALDDVLASGAIDVWLDLSEVAFMDSSGVRVLLTARRAVSGNGRRLAVICPAGPVRRVLQIAGVDSALAIYPDRASAHAAG